ncbi:MAG: hypothetical protein ACLRV8_08965 [Blautia hansenii]
MKNLILRGIVVGPVQTNCYFLKHKETGNLLLQTREPKRRELFMRWKNCRESQRPYCLPMVIMTISVQPMN